MSEGSGITPITVDWSQAPKAPNYFGDYINAFNVGREMAAQKITQNAFRSYAQDPTAPLDPNLAAANPAAYMQVANAQRAAQTQAGNVTGATALANGDYTGAAQAYGANGDRAGVTDAQTDQTKAQADLTDKAVGFLHGVLLHPDPSERLSLIQHAATVSPQVGAIFHHAGIDPGSLTPDMLTNQNLLGVMQALQGGKAAEANDKPQIVGKDSSLLFAPGSLGAAGAQGSPQGAGPAAGQAPAAAPVQASPVDMDSLARAIYAEAGGEPAQGQAAVAHVILNRAQAGYGGAKSIADVVNAPGQFEGMTSPRAGVSTGDPGYQKALQIAQGVVSGQIPDPTGGADHFLNPQLQAQLGRQQPGWANGNGQRIGNHVFYGGQGGGDAPYQVASNGPTSPPPSQGGAKTLPGGYALVSPGGPAQAPDGGHVATAAEKSAAGLDPTSQAWVDGKGKIGALPEGLSPPSGGAFNIPGDPMKTGPEFLATVKDPALAGQIKAVAEGRMVLPSPTSFAFKSPEVQRLINGVAQYAPGFDAADQPKRIAAAKAFASGPQSKTIVALNTLLDHLGERDQAIARLGNTDFPAANAMGNALRPQLGDTTLASALSNFKTIHNAAMSDLATVLQGGPPHEGQLQQFQKDGGPDGSPAAQRAQGQAAARLAMDRLNELSTQWKSAMGVERDPMSFIRPAAAANLQRLLGNGGGGGGGGAAPRAAAPAPHVAPTGAGHLTNAQLQAELQKLGLAH